MEMKMIIAGGRDFNDKVLACREFSNFCGDLNINFDKVSPVTEIVSGGARGADKVGEFVAKFYNVPVKQFIPDWEGLGKRAGFVRNAEMGDYADCLLAFWDKKSRGTKQMIEYATKKGLIVKVVYY